VLSIEQSKSRTSELKLKMNKLQPVLNQIKDVNTQMGSLGPRLASLQDAQASTQKWSSIMDHMTHNTPGGIWLTLMKSKEPTKDAPTQITLGGIALTQDSVATFMLNLKKSEHLEKVELKYTMPQVINDQTMFKFELTMGVAGTGGKGDDKKKPKPGTISEHKEAAKEAGA
jgi:Tfp pilus assembly protein PilN